MRLKEMRRYPNEPVGTLEKVIQQKPFEAVDSENGEKRRARTISLTWAIIRLPCGGGLG